MKVLILGAGLIGRPMALDLVKDKYFQITVVDINKNNLNKIPKELPIKKIEKDISKSSELLKLLKKN
jgi:saccharopine dehydrogenase-like NADP-dependent oxidoreductase